MTCPGLNLGLLNRSFKATGCLVGPQPLPSFVFTLIPLMVVILGEDTPCPQRDSEAKMWVLETDLRVDSHSEEGNAESSRQLKEAVHGISVSRLTLCARQAQEKAAELSSTRVLSADSSQYSTVFWGIRAKHPLLALPAWPRSTAKLWRPQKAVFSEIYENLALES